MIDGLDTLQPGESATRFVEGHSLLIVRLHGSGALFLVACTSCHRLVESATAGPEWASEKHAATVRSG